MVRRRVNARTQYEKDAEELDNQQVNSPEVQTLTINEPSTSQETDQRDTMPQNGTSHHSTVLPRNSGKPQEDEEALEKVSFYITTSQLNKLYDLVNEYRKRTGVRKVNRNDIIRLIIDQTDIEHLLKPQYSEAP